MRPWKRLHPRQACAAEEPVPPPAAAQDRRAGHRAGNDGRQFEALLDVTIVYPNGTPRFWDLLCGRVDAVVVRVQQREIPPGVLGSDPVGDKPYRQRINAWVEQQWAEKDGLIDELLRADGDVAG
jgi:hypothetical protein